MRDFCVISFKAVTSFLVCSGKCAPLYPNVVFLCLPRSLTAALFCSFPTEGSHRKIISHSDGHSVVTGFWATKKPAHQCAPTWQKGRLPPFCEGWFHINVTGFEIQSRNCLLRLTSADSSGRIRKRRYFLLAYRRRYPAFSRPFNPL